MSLPLPNLDDRSFKELVDEGIAMIPRYTTEWTNFNPSDPGITLIELLAWVAEATLYRLNRISDQEYDSFLHLIGISRQAQETLSDAFTRTNDALNAPTRLVTLSDYETMVAQCDNEQVSALTKKIIEGQAVKLEDFAILNTALPTRVARAKAFTAGRPGTVRVVVLPTRAAAGIASDVIDVCKTLQQKIGKGVFDAMLNTINRNIDVFRLVTTQVDIRLPRFKPLSITVDVYRDDGYLSDSVKARVETRLMVMMSIYGDAQHAGWAFGQALHRYEIYEVIEGIEGVDYVDRLRLNNDEAIGSVLLEPDQLFCINKLVVNIKAHE